jgi:hypothetical protein
MAIIQNILSTDVADDLFKFTGSDQLVHDWQAIRIVRDGYVEAWKLLMTYFTWFSFTLLGVGAYALRADLHPDYILVFGVVGDIAIVIQIGVLLTFRTTITKTKKNIARIITMGGVINKEYITPNLIVGGRFAERVIYFMMSGMLLALTFWSILFLYVLVRYPH